MKLQFERRVLLALAVVAVIIVFVGSFLVYFFYFQTPSKPQWAVADAENDVAIDIGTEYPGMIDVVRVVLEVDGSSLKITIETKDILSDLGNGEFAQWNATVILENEFLKAYELVAELNSTEFSGYIVELGESNPIACQVVRNQKSLSISTSLEELSTTNRIDWFVLSTFEKYSGSELVASCSDIAPNEGPQETILKS